MYPQQQEHQDPIVVGISASDLQIAVKKLIKNLIKNLKNCNVTKLSKYYC
jgi:hypothetical protein